MKLTGYRNYLWEADGYRAGIANGIVPTGSAIPNMLYRTAYTPVFGPSQIAELTIPVEFIYSGALSYEDAWIALLKRLDPLNAFPATLTGTLNNGQGIQTTALLTIPSQTDEEVNTLTVTFVAADPFFTGTTRTTQSQVFA